MKRLASICFSAAVATNIAFGRAVTMNALQFSEPVRFSDALTARDVRSILQTDLGTADLQQIDSAILERAIFSARVTNAEYLQTIDDVLRRYLNGEINLATARLELKQKLWQLGYKAAPEDEGTLRDFASTERTNLVLRTNMQMAAGYGNWLHDQQQPILDHWPAWEFLRVAPRMNPRTDWLERFSAAGGRVFPSDHPAFALERRTPRAGIDPRGRMIALRNTPVWTNLSRFGLPYPPFDFNSGMGVRLITRTIALELGVMDKDTPRLKPQDRGFNDDLRFEPKIRAEALRQALLESDDRLRFDGDVLTLEEEL